MVLELKIDAGMQGHREVEKLIQDLSCYAIYSGNITLCYVNTLYI